MVEKFKVFEDDELGYRDWLDQNSNGFVLNSERPPRPNYMRLHTAECHHIKYPATHANTDPFTSRGYMKVCANDPADLLVWMEAKGATKFSHLCSKCGVADLIKIAEKLQSKSTKNDWTEQELRAAVISYLKMQSKELNGEAFSKKQFYEILAGEYGRSSKAFEYRMQNISYVLSLMGRDWIAGLKPAKNVGRKVAHAIESLVLELTHSFNSPFVAFEIEVREKVDDKRQEIPIGNRNPGTTRTEVTQFIRDPAVKAWVLKQAAGICECCGAYAPFENTDGQPFLEVHHVRKLAAGGSDTVSNAVALCPNCHRAMHYGIKAKELVDLLVCKVIRLIPE
ncbi:HNH endonuclease [Comamonas sediminis]|uniref:HNH endonuclease n=1 Tax=Comamonas sediminis TaxID=1783360 RepID=A0ABV4B2F0_9BURK